MLLCHNINKYDCFVFLLIASLAAGNVGGALQPGRLLTIFLIPYLLKNRRLVLKCRAINRVLLFFLFWMAYSFISLLWCLDKGQAGKDIVYYPIHMFTFLEITVFTFRSQRPVESMMKGWAAALLITFPIAFTEIFTNIHLPSTYQYHEENRMIKLGDLAIQQQYAAVTFGNYNSYGTFLCFASPFILGLIIRLKSFIGQIFSYAIFFSIVYISIINGSRGAFLSLSIMIVIFLMYQKKYSRKSTKYIFVLVLLGACFLLWEYGADIFLQLQARVEGKSSIMEDDGRSQLIVLSLEATLNSFFLGNGIGSMEKALGGGGTATHNFVLELLIQFGLVITLMVVFFIINLYLWSRGNYVPKDLGFIVKASILSFVFIMVINSGYLRDLMTWVYFGSLFAIVLVTKYRS